MARLAALLLLLPFGAALAGCFEERIDALRRESRVRRAEAERLRAEGAARDTVVLYFRSAWHGVAYEVLARRTLLDFESLTATDLAAHLGWLESVEREAREVFARRYGFAPPGDFPPREPLDIDTPDVSWRGALIALADAPRWHELLDERGLRTVADVAPYLEEIARQRGEERRLEELALRHGVSVGQAVELGEILATLQALEVAAEDGTGAVALRELPDYRWLELLERFALARPLTDRDEPTWTLTEEGERLIRETTPPLRALSIQQCGFRPDDDLPGPRMDGRYYALARVIEAVADERDPAQWLTVELIAGAARVAGRVSFAGEVAEVFHHAPDAAGLEWQVRPGDLVGYVEPGEWERAPPSALGAPWHGRELDPNEVYAFGLCSSIAREVLEVPADRRGAVLRRLATVFQSDEHLSGWDALVGALEGENLSEVAAVLRARESPSRELPSEPVEIERFVRLWASCNGLQLAVRGGWPETAPAPPRLGDEPCAATTASVTGRFSR